MSKESREMQFLVIGESTETGPLLPAEQVVTLLEQRVLPSLEMLDKWEAEGRVRGGVFPGERRGAHILEAASPEEANQVLTSLPFWGAKQVGRKGSHVVAFRNRAGTEGRRATESSEVAGSG